MIFLAPLIFFPAFESFAALSERAAPGSPSLVKQAHSQLHAKSMGVSSTETARGFRNEAHLNRSGLKFQGSDRLDSRVRGSFGLPGASQNRIHNHKKQKPENPYKTSIKKPKKTYSWFFDARRTKQELVLMPVYFRSRVYGSNWGLRFFTFPAEPDGFYGSLSVLNKFLEPYFKIKSLYRREYPRNWRLHFQAEYSNYFEPWYGEGMKTALTDRKDLHAHRLRVDQTFKFTNPHRIFYAPGVSWIFRREIPALQQGIQYFKEESLLLFKGTLGYDSRDSWENTKKGQYHRLSLSCAPRRAESACLTEGDLRFYFSPHKRAVLALRGFAGTAVFHPFSYSLKYKLGGSKVFRGFTAGRFRGDKIYFAQSELRVDLWGDFFSGALFFETGAVSDFGKKRAFPRRSYGAGLRFGMPPSHKIKLRADAGFSDGGEYNITVDFHQSF